MADSYNESHVTKIFILKNSEHFFVGYNESYEMYFNLWVLTHGSTFSVGLESNLIPTILIACF